MDLQTAKEETCCSSCACTIKVNDEMVVGEDGPLCLRCAENATQDSYEMLGLCPHGVSDDGDCEECGGPGGADNHPDPWSDGDAEGWDADWWDG